MTSTPKIFLLVCLAGLGLNRYINNEPAISPFMQTSNPVHPSAISVPQEPDLRIDGARFVDFFRRYPLMSDYQENLKSFYAKRRYTYAWFERNHLVEQATIWSNRLLNVEAEGVYKHFPYQKKLDSLLDNVKVKANIKTPDLDLELLLTCSYFEYSKLVWNGMDDAASRSANWLIPRKAITYDQYLDSILKTPANKSYPSGPVYRQYELLRTELEKYRQLESEEWKPIRGAAESARLGDKSEILLKIKARLFKLGDYRADTSNNNFDQSLFLAIQRFQERNGLIANGRLNPQTMAELNVPIKGRIKQIIVNMERSRWLPLQVAGDYIAVNIPEFRMHVYHADSLLWSCNAVVGQTIHPTTQFYGEIKYIMFSPYWNVPPGILKNEVLPAMEKDPNYLASHQMEIADYQGGMPVIRQKPGPTNALGQVKFMFPNSYNIYLHDTPAKSLFSEASRAFSHGCIRISEPAKLAGFLLRNKQEWSPDKIRVAMRSGKEKQVVLSKPVPVFIAYFTAFVDRDNRLNFRKDIYNLDNRLAEMITSGNDHLRK